MSGERLQLELPRPFELKLALFGHGWIDLAPNHWDEESSSWSTVLGLGRGAVDLRLRQQRARLEVGVPSQPQLTSAARAQIPVAVRHMLRLDEDFGRFYALCSGHPELAWVARRGAGRMLRAPTLFEDLAKLLLTTNCTWLQTRAMVERLCTALGKRAPSNTPSFPDAKRVASVSEAYLRKELRLGYRAPALLELAERMTCRKELAALARPCSRDALRAALMSLRGFGPYAVGQALRLLGHYTDYALDSWCQSQLSRRGRAATPRALARRYGRFNEYRGLALWMDLTAPWHAEGPFVSEGQTALSLAPV